MTPPARIVGLLAEGATALLRREPADFAHPGLHLPDAPYLGPVTTDSGASSNSSPWRDSSPVRSAPCLPPPANLPSHDPPYRESLTRPRLLPSAFCLLPFPMIRAIEDVLRHHMGLEASTIGTATVERAIRARMAHVAAANTDDYLLRLRETPAELDELTEAVVVPESWFFRDGAPSRLSSPGRVNTGSPPIPARPCACSPCRAPPARNPLRSPWLSSIPACRPPASRSPPSTSAAAPWPAPNAASTVSTLSGVTPSIPRPLFHPYPGGLRPCAGGPAAGAL